MAQDCLFAWLKGYGGETGIRTLGTRKGTTVFETAPFDHSGTSPQKFRFCSLSVSLNIGTGRTTQQQMHLVMIEYSQAWRHFCRVDLQKSDGFAG